MNSYPVCEPRRTDDPLDVELTHRLNERVSSPESGDLSPDAPALRELAVWMGAGMVFCGLCLVLLV